MKTKYIVVVKIPACHTYEVKLASNIMRKLGKDFDQAMEYISYYRAIDPIKLANMTEYKSTNIDENMVPAVYKSSDSALSFGRRAYKVSNTNLDQTSVIINGIFDSKLEDEFKDVIILRYIGTNFPSDILPIEDMIIKWERPQGFKSKLYYINSASVVMEEPEWLNSRMPINEDKVSIIEVRSVREKKSEFIVAGV